MGFVVGKIYYINKVPVAGWLVVAVKSSGVRVSLLEYTKVKITENSNHRVYFEVMDGGQKGMVVSRL